MLLLLFLRLLHLHWGADALRHGLCSQRGALSRSVNWIGAGRFPEQASLQHGGASVVRGSPEARKFEAPWMMLCMGRPSSAGQCHWGMAGQGVVDGALRLGPEQKLNGAYRDA